MRACVDVVAGARACATVGVLWPDDFIRCKEHVTEDHICFVKAAVERSREEPGLIVTNFGEVAAGSVDAAGESGGPYAEFNRRVAARTAGAYHGPLAKLGGPPESVAETIAKALSATRPKPRYAVTPSAHLLIGQRRITPDRAWDLMMRTQFPTPRDL